MLDKELGHEIPTSQMQFNVLPYNTHYKETDQEDQCFLSLEGMVLDNLEKIKYFGITISNDLKRFGIYASNICTEVTWRHAHRTLKSQHRDWCVQSWSKVVQFGTSEV